MNSATLGRRSRPADLGAEFVLGLEQECLTAVVGAPRSEFGDLLPRLMKRLRELAPSLQAERGFFNPYGRIYIDSGLHLELASMECDSPYLLAQVVEQQQRLVATAAGSFTEAKPRLVLANNNHSGLLSAEAPTWGAHENYLVERHPRGLARALLPFLATRLYAGAGGLEHPQGRFLACVRPLFMRGDVGGGTTRERAVFSLAREEHLMGPLPKRFRLHLIVGDGLRSQFGLALTFGATALALKAIQVDLPLRRYLAKLKSSPVGNSWMAALRHFNVLACPGDAPRVDPLALEIQRAYLEGARRYAQELPSPPAWIERTLGDWDDTLTALARDDRSWLSARLDAFIKYELISEVLRAAGCTWQQLPSQPYLFHELALLDQAYHAFTSADSPFTQLDRAGVLQQRVAPLVAPGAEHESFVPQTGTRARARARFLVENAGKAQLVMGWSRVFCDSESERCLLAHPFAQEYSPWESVAAPDTFSELERLIRRPDAS